MTFILDLFSSFQFNFRIKILGLFEYILTNFTIGPSKPKHTLTCVLIHTIDASTTIETWTTSAFSANL